MYWVYAGLFVAGAEGLVDIAVEEGTVLIGSHNTRVLYLADSRFYCQEFVYIISVVHQWTFSVWKTTFGCDNIKIEASFHSFNYSIFSR